MEKSMTVEKILMGTCYYPEHWERNLWDDDLKRMLANGIEIIRIGEFAWSKFEPTEGTYTFDFFDAFMEVAQNNGMKVIFGTPTATPPAWLTNRYPEVLNADQEGVLYRHGCRRHYNYNSEKYQVFCQQITTKITEHYGSHPNIIGWQIDNELNCELNEFYSDSDTDAFRSFLKEKYDDLDTLNNAWGTVFWNQTYTDWEEIYLPRKTVSNTTNPHQVLDYYRFISWSARRFAKMQSDIIRRYIGKDVFITTNGMFPNLDNHQMTEESLDFYTYDSYPNFAYCLREDPRHSDSLNDRKWSRNLTEVRSISANFGIMEQQSGANGWNTRMEAPAPKPGQMTLWTMQSVAHGADFINYFRWRTCTQGTEMYWHGILDYSGRDNRRLQEVKQIVERFAHLKEVAGSRNQVGFGILKDYDNIWDSQLDLWHQRVDAVSQAGLFQAAQLCHAPMDYVYLRDNTSLEDLKQYPVLFYPHAVILTKERVNLLTKYVSEGGTLILGCRTGYKDITGKCVMSHLPGLLQELSGTDIPDYTFVGPNDGLVRFDWDGEVAEAAVFNDILVADAETASVIGRYQDNYYQGEAALIKNEYGQGQVYYFGGAFSRDTANLFLHKLGLAEPWLDVIQLPEACELTVRGNEEHNYLFVLNYSDQEQDILLKSELVDMDTDTVISGNVNLAAYETKVYQAGLLT